MPSQTSAEFISAIEYRLSEMWLNPPWQFKKINIGSIDSGAGRGGQYLACYQGLQDCLIGIGPDVLFRFVQMSETDSYSVRDLANAVVGILQAGEDPFQKMELCGLTGFYEIGLQYVQVINAPTLSLIEFHDVTQALWQLLVRAHRWNHMFFPWNMGAAYPQRLPQSMNDMVSSVMPAHPTKSRAESQKIDFNTYTFTPWQAPVTGAALPKKELSSPKWQSFIEIVDSLTAEIWTEKPWEIEKIEFGLINGGAGSGFQYYSDLVHLLTYLRLSGSIVVFGLTAQVNHGVLNVDVAKAMLRVILLDTFNAFEFLADLGLANFHWLGTKIDEEQPYTGLYWQALSDPLTTKAELVKINEAYLHYINRMLAWVEYIYPWNMGGRFPRQTDLDVAVSCNVMLQHPTP